MNGWEFLDHNMGAVAFVTCFCVFWAAMAWGKA